MGIHQFFKIIIKNSKSTFNGKPLKALGHPITLSKLKGSRICIDASAMIYRSMLALPDFLTDKGGRITSHINTILNKVIQLDSAHIEQIWIFDSEKPNPIKKEELARRKARSEKASDPKMRYRMTDAHVADIKTLLTLMGVPWIEAPEGVEAEQYGAWTTREPVKSNRFCQYVLSGDSDVIAFGGNLLRPLTGSGASYEVYELNEILHEAGITYKQLLYMAVVMGTDFNNKTPRIGPKTVIDKVKSGIELTPQQEKIAKYYYHSISDKIGYSDININTYDKDKLIEFLVSASFNEDRVRKRLQNFPHKN